MEIVIAARFSRGLEASQATLVGSDQVTGYGWAGCENQWVANTDCSKDNVSDTVSVQNRIRKVSFILLLKIITHNLIAQALESECPDHKDKSHTVRT